MAKTICFDNEKYLAQQSDAILERVNRFDNKLYLEFGGKLLSQNIITSLSHFKKENLHGKMLSLDLEET
jgi:uncharacterized protein (UPF0371 family)